MKKILYTTFALALVLVMGLTACQGATPTEVVETQPPATEEVMTEEPTEAVVEPVATLRIWADDTRTPILQGLAEEFLNEYNVELVVEDLGVVQDIRSQVIIAIPAGEGPDIYIGVHDWLGEIVESGLAAPLDLGDKSDAFVQSALDAFTYTDGNLYGMPYATENMGFFYNTDLVETPPTTWDEMLVMGRALQDEGLVEYATAIAGDPGYNSYPMQDAFGGYVFGKDENGAWNPDDLGLDSEGEIAAVQWMVDAVNEGLMPETTDYETAHAMFESGDIPFLMAGPWALDRIRASGVNYAVAPFFPDESAPLMGVQGFLINPFSENVLLAQAFLTEFVATDPVMEELYTTGNRPSAFTSVLAMTDDEDLKAMGEAGANAVPMPNIPEMGSVWSAWNNGIALALTGDLTAEESMTEAATQIRELIAGALAGMVNLPGSYQSLAGCGADWDPACAATGMTEGDDGMYTLTVDLPAGEYEFKVALDGDWGVNYGSDGAQDGPNYPLVLDADSTVTFVYDPETHLVEMTIE